MKICVYSHARRFFSGFTAFTLVFIFSFSLFSGNVHAAYTEESFSEIIAVILDSWGISFRSSPDGDILSDLNSLTDEFLSDNQYIQDEFFRGIQVGVDKLGQLLIDNTTLGKVIQFANWLINKYNLENNSSINIRPSNNLNYAFVGDAYCLVLNDSNDEFFASYVKYSNLASGSASDLYLYLDGSYPAYLTLYSYNGYSRPAIYIPGGFSSITFINSANGSSTLRATNSSSSNSFVWPDGRYLNIPNFPLRQFDYIPTSVEIFGDFSITPISAPSSDPLYINTQTIDIPNPLVDDGLVISVPGVDWGSTLSDVLDLIERLLILYDDSQLGVLSILKTVEDIVDSLQNPVDIQESYTAIVPPLSESDYNIPIETSWLGFASPFVQNVDSLRFWHDVVYSFPAPIINIFIAFACFLFIYAFVRMGRDSH